MSGSLFCLYHARACGHRNIEMSQQRLLAGKHDCKQCSNTMCFGERDVNIAFILSKMPLVVANFRTGYKIKSIWKIKKTKSE